MICCCFAVVDLLSFPLHRHRTEAAASSTAISPPEVVGPASCTPVSQAPEGLLLGGGRVVRRRAVSPTQRLSQAWTLHHLLIAFLKPHLKAVLCPPHSDHNDLEHRTLTELTPASSPPVALRMKSQLLIPPGRPAGLGLGGGGALCEPPAQDHLPAGPCPAVSSSMNALHPAFPRTGSIHSFRSQLK